MRSVLVLRFPPRLDTSKVSKTTRKPPSGSNRSNSRSRRSRASSNSAVWPDRSWRCSACSAMRYRPEDRCKWPPVRIRRGFSVASSAPAGRATTARLENQQAQTTTTLQIIKMVMNIFGDGRVSILHILAMKTVLMVGWWMSWWEVRLRVDEMEIWASVVLLLLAACTHQMLQRLGRLFLPQAEQQSLFSHNTLSSVWSSKQTLSRWDVWWPRQARNVLFNKENTF